jgi:peroxiredoxin
MKRILIFSLFIIAVNLQSFAGGYVVGDVARSFSLKNTDGKKTGTESIDAKGYIVIFTCNHCPFAQAYEERIMALDKKYASLGYPVIAINPNDPVREPADSYENMVKRAKEMKYTFPYLFDETQEIAAAYGALKTPHVYVLKKEKSKMFVRYTGAIDNNTEEPEKANLKYVENAVDALLANKPVPVTETKAIGCSIKWKQQN